MRFGQVLCWLLAIPFKSENNEGTEKIIADSKHIVSFARLHVPQNSQLEQTNLFNKRFRLKEDRILYVDDSIIVVNKPAGIQTAPGFNSNYSLATIVHEKFKITEGIESITSHRLDLATSGIVIFARHIKALKELQKQFRQREVKKKYSAVLHGRLLQKSGLIDYPIGRDTVFGPPCFAIDSTSTGKEAITRYEVIEESDCCSKLELFPLTGRTHQLRLHTAAIGHPILGDFFYARPQIYKSAQRLMLHAEEVEFLHPVTNKRMHVVSKSAFDLTDFNHYFSRLD